MQTLSIVVPCYNEEAVLPLFFQRVSKSVAALDVSPEYVFVDDGSRDGTLTLLRALTEANGNVHYISFSRNLARKRRFTRGFPSLRAVLSC